LLLPKEIRLKVYENVLLPVDDEPIFLVWPPRGQPCDLDPIDPPLLLVNSVVHVEAREIYYSQNVFLCSSTPNPNLRVLAMLAGTIVKKIFVGVLDKTSPDQFSYRMGDLFLS
jgi:hypothetical protein